MIDQLRSLTGLPRLLIPFGDEVDGASVVKLEAESTELDQTSVKEVEEEQEFSRPLLNSLRGTSRNVQRSEDFVVWLVESILGEFRTLFASDLDGVADSCSKVESIGSASSILSSIPFAGLCGWTPCLCTKWNLKGRVTQRRVICSSLRKIIQCQPLTPRMPHMPQENNTNRGRPSPQLLQWLKANPKIQFLAQYFVHLFILQICLRLWLSIISKESLLGTREHRARRH